MAVWLEIKEMGMVIQGRWLIMWGAFRGICLKQTKTNKSHDRDSDPKFCLKVPNNVDNVSCSLPVSVTYSDVIDGC